MDISRRSFLKGAVAAAASAAVGAVPMMSAAAEESGANAYNWADAADVVIVGGGGAGFSAAIEAGRAGASVLILEKAGFCGGNTALCGGMILAAGTPLQKELAGYDGTGDAERYAEQQIRYAQGYADEDMIREMCMESADDVQFMVDQGRVYKQVDIVPPVWSMDDDATWAPRCHWDNSNQTGHFVILQNTVSKMSNVRAVTNMEVVELIQNDAGAVIGVKTKDGSLVRANRGVILSCGSFDMNMEMSRSFNAQNYWALTVVSATGANSARSGQCVTNTGDGIRMAQKIGAALKLSDANCMAERQYYGGVGYGIINDMYGVDYHNEYNSVPIRGMICVNRNGLRFVQEDADWGYVTTESFKQCRKYGWQVGQPYVVWSIVDSNCLQSDMLAYSNTQDPDYAKLVVSADTLEELATKAGIDAENLKDTVARWNAFSAAGKDPDYDRRTDFGTIEQGPFYAMPLVPNPMGSFGGVMTNRDTAVLDLDGNVIPGLYAAGTTMSGMYTGPFYPGCGYSILGVTHWGRKAGKVAAAAESWTDEPVQSMLGMDEEEAVEGNGNYNPGVYVATSEGRNGPMKVNVTFSETAITGVVVIEHSETAGIGDAAIETLPGKIVRRQTVDVDSVAGATITSEAIKQAVADCIAQASK